jgi:hypothetical protein
VPPFLGTALRLSLRFYNRTAPARLFGSRAKFHILALESRLDIRHNGFRLFGLIAQIPVTLQALLHAGDRFAGCQARHVDQSRAPSASSILKGFALPVCASCFRPMVKTYVLCPVVTLMLRCDHRFTVKVMSSCVLPSGDLSVPLSSFMSLPML